MFFPFNEHDQSPFSFIENYVKQNAMAKNHSVEINAFIILDK